MARVRIPGGFLDAQQLRQIASITEDLTEWVYPDNHAGKFANQGYPTGKYGQGIEKA